LIVLLYTALVWSHLEYCALTYKNDIKLLECVQRMATKMVKDKEKRIYNI